MKKEKIEEFISSTVVHELIENNLGLLDFLRSRNDALVSRDSLDTLSVIFRERDKLIKLLGEFCGLVSTIEWTFACDVIVCTIAQYRIFTL